MSKVFYHVVPSDELQLNARFNELLLIQWDEVDERRKSAELNVQWESYKAADRAGMQFWLLAIEYDSDGNQTDILGYISMLVCPSMHTGELTALTDTMYVLPSQRGTGVGTQLLSKAEAIVAAKGAKHMMVTFKNDVNHAPLADRLGLFNYETVYCKSL